jgi:hypothetical protein
LTFDQNRSNPKKGITLTNASKKMHNVGILRIQCGRVVEEIKLNVSLRKNKIFG